MTSTKETKQSNSFAKYLPLSLGISLISGLKELRICSLSSFFATFWCAVLIDTYISNISLVLYILYRRKKLRTILLFELNNRLVAPLVSVRIIRRVYDFLLYPAF